MVDAMIVPVPRQRNSRDENDQVKIGATPEDWKKRPSKNRRRTRTRAGRRSMEPAPKWIRPQLTRLGADAPMVRRLSGSGSPQSRH